MTHDQLMAFLAEGDPIIPSPDTLDSIALFDDFFPFYLQPFIVAGRREAGQAVKWFLERGAEAEVFNIRQRRYTTNIFTIAVKGASVSTLVEFRMICRDEFPLEFV